MVPHEELLGPRDSGIHILSVVGLTQGFGGVRHEVSEAKCRVDRKWLNSTQKCCGGFLSPVSYKPVEAGTLVVAPLLRWLPRYS